MAIPAPLAEFLGCEHDFNPLPKRILLLGRQTMLFDEARCRAILASVGVKPAQLRLERDRQTVHAKNNPGEFFVTDQSFFGALGVETVDALDIDAFEGANVLADICGELPAELHGAYDFVFNGSVLDNVFDPGAALRNVSRLLRPGGRVVHIETASTYRYSYAALSPSWFFDFYAANEWADCKVYVAACENPSSALTGPWPVIAYANSADTPRQNAFTPGFGTFTAIQIILAEKGAQSSDGRRPIQGYYRSDADWNRHEAAAARMRSHPRPFRIADDSDGSAIPSLESAWFSCGHWKGAA